MCNRKNSKQIGIVSETMVIAALTKLGYSVSLPYGDNCAYDLIADIDGDLKKIQVKTAFDTDYGTICVKVCSQQKKILNKVIVGDTIKQYTKKDIDFIATYTRLYNRVYLIPIEAVTNEKSIFIQLRVRKSKYKIRKTCSNARKYEIYRF